VGGEGTPDTVPGAVMPGTVSAIRFRLRGLWT
jgi:hypothetical protein